MELYNVTRSRLRYSHDIEGRPRENWNPNRIILIRWVLTIPRRSFGDSLRAAVYAITSVYGRYIYISDACKYVSPARFANQWAGMCTPRIWQRASNKKREGPPNEKKENCRTGSNICWTFETADLTSRYHPHCVRSVRDFTKVSPSRDSVSGSVDFPLNRWVWNPRFPGSLLD